MTSPPSPQHAPLYNITMLIINILGYTINKEATTKNMGNINVDADYIPTLIYNIQEAYVVVYTIYIGWKTMYI